MTKPIIVTLCGSTRFKDDFIRWNRKLTLENIIVLMPGVFGHSGDEMTEEQKENLDCLHKHKIAMSDFIFVIDRDGYVGKSTSEEIGFAKALGLDIYYMSEQENDEE